MNLVAVSRLSGVNFAYRFVASGGFVLRFPSPAVVFMVQCQTTVNVASTVSFIFNEVGVDVDLGSNFEVGAITVVARTDMNNRGNLIPAGFGVGGVKTFEVTQTGTVALYCTIGYGYE